jgi:3-hydroxyisobutyrate dehydrogenase-like beta-hydroxyacid dehydrogenase
MKVGIIGIGNMGFRIAKRFLENNIEVGIYDINEKVTRKLASHGAKVFDNPRLLALTYSRIITILPNVDIVKDTLLGKDGLLEGFHDDSILIEMTTSIPSITKELAKSVREKGYRMVDAPVSGGISKAEVGKLAIMVGGEYEDFEDVKPLLSFIGENILHAGEIGAGHTIKALNNLISATTLAITGEALALGARLGLEPDKMLAVINSSTGRSLSSEFKFPKHILPRTFSSGFTLDLMVKDLTIAMNMAQEEKVPMYIASSAYQLWKQAHMEADMHTDHTSVIQTIEKMMESEINM